MQLTLASLIGMIEQELGRPVSPRSGTAEALVNEAGEAWVNLFSWNYLREQSREVALVRGVEAYPLGAGVRSLGRELHRKDSVYPPIPIISHDTWLVERERYLSDIEYQLTPIATSTYAAGDSGLELTLMVYPASLEEAVEVRFQAGWLPLDNRTDVAMVPPQLAHAFREWVRMFAMGREKPELVGGVAGVTAAFMQGPIMLQAKTADTEHVGRLTFGPGGAGAYYKGRGEQERRDQLDHLRYHRDYPYRA